MPRFQYTATDSLGALQVGEIEAANQNEAIQALSRGGFSVSSITRSTASVPPGSASRPSVPKPAPISAAPPLAARSAYDPTAPLRPLPTTSSRPLSHKELYLYFIQLSNLLQSGLTPANALTELARRPMRKDLSEASFKMAAWTTEGRGLHEAMAAFPDLFPRGTRGAIECGSVGGYLWEAAEMAAEQAKSTHAIQRSLWYVWWAFLSLFGSVLIGLIGQGAVKGAIRYAFEGQGTMDEAVNQGLRQGLGGVIGVVVALLIVSTVGLRIWFKTKSSRSTRHMMAYRLPMAKKRTINECFTHFSWHLGKLAKAGVSPVSSYQVAAKAVPNDAYHAELLRTAQNRPDSARLSTILYESRLFPREYAATVETGEIAGRVGEALDQASALSLQEVREQERYVKWRVGCWAAMAFLLSGLIGFGILYATYFRETIHQFNISEP